jgi:hypothetical protein
MGSVKPHLLVKVINNLGVETHIKYAASTKFYRADEAAGNPWITRIPFPVHVVERVETIDRISKSRFVSRYRYHHGYYDRAEREFRGFGMVEQEDTETYASFSAGGKPADAASHVPPVLTKTWFHTGFFAGRKRISTCFEKEYYREPGKTDPLLPDTVLPEGLSAEEAREACRAWKG